MPDSFVPIESDDPVSFPSNYTPTVAIVTVTYGYRKDFLSQVINGIFEQTKVEHIQQIVVCNNGASPETTLFLNECAEVDTRFCIVEMNENKGSAEGYAAAIAKAAEAEADYIWCLDDDNRPAPDALEKLLTAVERGNPQAVYLSLRDDREQYIKRANGLPLEQSFERKYSFLGFSLFDIPRKIQSRLRKKKVNGEGSYGLFNEEALSVPYAPYGGLFFKTNDLYEVGLPRTDFFLYGDDHEFTARFIQRHHPIYLIPSSHITDVEQSWHIKRTETTQWGSNRLLRDGEMNKAGRLFYSVRNRVFFEMHSRGWKSHPLYHLNCGIYLLLLWAQAIVYHLKGERTPWQSYMTLLDAVKAGKEQKLGKSEEYQL